MIGGMKHIKRPIQRKILPERNVCKEEPEQIRNDINRQEKKLIGFVKRKRNWLNNRIKQIEDAHTQNETRKFFKDIRTFQNDRSPPIFICKDKNGTLKTDKQEVLDRWKQYFVDLMKTDKETVDQTQEGNIIENETEIDQPTYNETSDIITKLKKNIASDTGNIPAELIKYGGYILKCRIYKLILLI
jgi:hypothetical protein